ncbi:MAG TPA: M1 family metallopeptidase [Planctomycetota bacterium]|nr:M1 family metallopeptidase [Planctomycetota bacterium]
MKLALISVFALFAIVQEKPWTPFNDPDNKPNPERVSTIDVLHYKISVRLDERIPEPIVEGRVEMDLAFTASTGTVELDAEEMVVTEVKAGKGDPLECRQEGGKLIVELGRKAPAGEKLHLDISYTARPSVGLFFITPDPQLPNRGWQVWSQGETEYNHHWFPCYDNPNDRATSEVVITVREKYRTISNGTLVKSTIHHGWRIEHWKMDVPHVAYLTSIAAGEFDMLEDREKVPIRYFVPKGWHSKEEISRTFKKTPDMMAFFAERTGVPYPYAKYDQVVVDDFTWGGMENITATTLHPGTVVKKRSWEDRDSDGLIAHELAHQWFGNLVTCRTWAHAWLNEGFATYMEALWREKSEGREAFIADLEDGLGWYLSEAANEYTRPTVCSHYTTPDDVFDSHIYPRGAWILRMLHDRLGNDAWWKGVNRYLTKHRAGLVTTDDFRVAMEEGSGQDLKPFFDQWLTKAGHPAFKVKAAWDAGSNKLTLTVEQAQEARKLVWKDLSTEVPIFAVPVDIEFETKKGRSVQRIEIKDKFHTFTFDLDSEPEIIDFDRDSALLKTLEFERSAAQLAHQLAKDDQPWHRWWAASKLAGAHDGVAALRQALHKDSSNRVRIAAAKALGATATAEARAALVGQAQTDARVRRAVLEALANHAKEAGEELEKAFRNDSSPACKAAAAASLGKRGATSSIFAEVEKYKEDEVVMPGLLSGMLGAGDPGFLKACLAATERSAHPQIRVRATECLGDYLAANSDPAALKRLLMLFDDSNFRVRRAAVSKAAGVKEGGKSVAGVLEKRLPREPEKRLAKDIRDAIKKLRAEK